MGSNRGLPNGPASSYVKTFHWRAPHKTIYGHKRRCVWNKAFLLGPIIWNKIITGRNEVVAKVMFLHVSVILFTGGASGEPPRTRQTPPLGPRRTPLQTRQTPPGPRRTPPPDQADPPGPDRHPPWDQGEPPLQTRQTPPDQADPPPGRTLQHTVNERPVRILLECILVLYFISPLFIMFLCVNQIPTTLTKSSKEYEQTMVDPK